MEKKTLQTEKGRIVYWTSGSNQSGGDKDTGIRIVFLPGLSADRRLFEKQTEYFSKSWNCLVWDPPAHGESRPFSLSFTMDDLASYLRQILEKEGGGPCVLAGQSFGGYVAQAFMSRYKSLVRGFISIDSAPLDRKYYSAAELWLLKHTYRLYMCFPWKLLVKSGSFSCAETEYGRKLMKTMMLSYGKKEYCRLAARGYRLLADALSMKHDIPACPVLLISGKKDRQITNIYNRRWARGAGKSVHWIEGAGHNSNADRPEEINRLIETFLKEITSPDGIQENFGQEYRIRRLAENDIPQMRELFRSTVLCVNSRDYTDEECKDWASCGDSTEHWKDLLSENDYFAALDGVGNIIGFSSMNAGGHLHSLFVHRDWQGKGVGTMLLSEAERLAMEYGAGKITSEVSITARPFFEKHGYKVVKEQKAKANRLYLTNYVMEKPCGTRILPVRTDKKRYLELLLVGDEQESMIDRYLERGEMYVMQDMSETAVAVAVVTDEGDGVLELKNLAVDPRFHRKGYGRKMIEYLCRHYSGRFRAMTAGTGDSVKTMSFYRNCGFSRSHTLEDFFVKNYDHPIIEEGKALKDMVYFKRNIQDR